MTDISLKLGVSDTSIIRFIRLLGFAGFADFKNTMKERMLEHYNLNLSPSQKFTNTKDKINSDNVVNDVFYKAIDNLSSTMLNLDDKLVNSIAECIIKVGINILLVLEEHLVVLIILHVKQCFLCRI